MSDPEDTLAKAIYDNDSNNNQTNSCHQGGNACNDGSTQILSSYHGEPSFVYCVEAATGTFEVNIRSLQDFSLKFSAQFKSSWYPQAICLSPDCSMVACGSEVVYIWNTFTGVVEFMLPESDLESDYFSLVEFSRTGSSILALTSNGGGFVWDIESRVKLPFKGARECVEGHFCLNDSSIICIRGLLDSEFVDGAIVTESVLLWDIESSVCIHKFEELDNRAVRLDVNAASTLAAAGCEDGSCWLCCLTSKSCRVFTHHRNVEMREVKFSPDDTKLLLLYGFMDLEVWDVECASAIFVMQFPFKDGTVFIFPSFTADGDKILFMADSSTYLVSSDGSSETPSKIDGVDYAMCVCCSRSMNILL